MIYIYVHQMMDALSDKHFRFNAFLLEVFP